MHKFGVSFSNLSSLQIEEILGYYKNIDAEICLKFQEELNILVKNLEDQPNIYQFRYKDFKRVNFFKFPFAIFYKIINKEVVIVSCLHQHRDPTYWP